MYNQSTYSEMMEQPAWWTVRPRLLATLGVLLLLCVAAWLGAAAYAVDAPLPQAWGRALHLMSYIGR